MESGADVSGLAIWISGAALSGKTSRLVGEFADDIESYTPSSSILVLAANDETKRKLGDRLAVAIEGSYPVVCKTPLGLMGDEVILFWPLIFEQLQLKAQFPLKLRPEMEQELATQFAHAQGFLEYKPQGVSEYRFIRQTLDLLQLAALGGYTPEEIPDCLENGLNLGEQRLFSTNMAALGVFLVQWQQWCLERGLLSYGILSALYSRYLLPQAKYQEQLIRRYQGVFADDVDDYPAIAGDLLEFFLEQGKSCVFTYNPQGEVRLGLGADARRLEKLSSRCRRVELKGLQGLAETAGETVINLVTEPIYPVGLPNVFELLQTTSRAQLLQKTAVRILEVLEQEIIAPQDLVIIAPGLDEIARYTLMEILTSGGVKVQPLNEQRPLSSSPLVRALLTALGLVYPGLGQLLPQDSIAEMLVILSHGEIDPVRGGLIADYCYEIDRDYPRLLGVESFSRWDRLGYKATTAYWTIRTWIEATRKAIAPSKLTPLMVLDSAIKFLLENQSFSYDSLDSLRELSETAQHFWEVDRKLRQNEPSFRSTIETVSQFIQLIRRGTITANPYPLRNFGEEKEGVMLATIFQYRSLRTSHRWQFWLDVGSPLWEKGGAATLLAAPLFLRDHSGIWGEEKSLAADQARLMRILQDLLSRAREKVILCHSDSGINGTEQVGPLLPMVQAVFS